MSFISLKFIVFILIVIAIYFAIPKRFQWVCLLVASYVFYLFSGIAVALFLIFSTVSIFYTGRLLGRINDRYQTELAEGKESLTKDQKKQLKDTVKKRKRLILAAALLINFGILAFLKYFNFFAENVNSLLGIFNAGAQLPQLNLLLPLGISFYTFQSAGYVIDVYRNKYKPDKNLAKFALFVSYFPQIVQGPISRYDQLAHQLYEPHSFDYTQVKYGIQLIAWGFFKKLVIADRAALLVNQVFNDHTQYAGLEILIAVILYCVQVYADFSGGMDIAIGVSQSLGIKLTKNFERPYFARSISEFWQRWHITLSAWVRDYLFYPLCLSKAFVKLGKFSRKYLGNYVGKILSTCLVTVIAFITIGIWHGASWKYVAYGLYNGGLITSALLLTPLFNRANKHINTKSFWWRLFQTLRTLLLVCIGRYFSRSASLMGALHMMKSTVSVFNPEIIFNGRLFELGLNQANFIVLIISVVLLFFVSLMQEKGFSIREKLGKQKIVWRWSVYFLVLFAIIIFGIYGTGYNASAFIYRGF